MSRNQKFISLGFSIVLLVATGIGVAMRKELSAQYAGYRLTCATDPDTRTVLAEELIARGPAATYTIAGLLKSGSPDVRMAVIDAVGQLPIADPNFAVMAGIVFDAMPYLDEASAEAALSLTPTAALEPTLVERAKAAVAAGLQGGPSARAVACRMATREGIELGAAVVPLLADPNAKVRQSAVLAIGPAGVGPPVVGEEELFKLLSDPDSHVCLLTVAALSTRGLDDRQIAMGRKLAHVDPQVRLSLLLDLKFAGDALKDPGPWLARLGKDSDPAIRAGAARVAIECQLTSVDWVHDLADRDPDPLVRQVAGHYRQRANDVRAVGGIDR